MFIQRISRYHVARRFGSRRPERWYLTKVTTSIRGFIEMKYYTDDELIEMVENYGETSLDSNWLANRIKERMENKDRIIDSQRDRLDVAAKYVGHNMLTELLEEGY